MTVFGFQNNTVFNWKDRTYRINQITPSQQVILEHTNDGFTSIVDYQDLLEAYREGHISFEQTTENHLEKVAYSRPFAQLPENEKGHIKRRKLYIDHVLQHGEPIFTPSYIKPLIQAAALAFEDDKPPSYITFYRWYKNYKRNPDVRGLRPRFDRRGRKIIGLCVFLQNLLIKTVEEAYKASPQALVTKIYNDFKSKIEIENQQRLPEQYLETPCERTFRRALHRFEVYELVRFKSGKAAADKKFRMVKSSTVTHNILERVEVDHTPLDLFLINKKTGMPMGRPTVTIFIDHYSRMILGYYISFQAPSTAAVMGALRHAILPKPHRNDGHMRLKINYYWLCYGLPDKLVVDNGMEFHSHDLESVAYDLGITIEYCPKHEPRFKGTVERFLKTLNYSFASQIPGASFAKWHLRGDYDPLKHAILDIEEFVCAFEKWVCDVYAQSKHSKINTTPYAKWQEGLERRQPKLPLSLDRIKSCIGKTETRSLRKDGILLQGIRYQSAELGSIVRAYGVGVRVRLLYDPADMGSIQVYGPDAEEPIQVLASDYEYAKGLTELQNEYIQKSLREKGIKSVDAHALSQAKFELSQFILGLSESNKLHENKKGAKLSGRSSSQLRSKILDDYEKLPKHKAKFSKKDVLKNIVSLSFDALPKLPRFTLERG